MVVAVAEQPAGAVGDQEQRGRSHAVEGEQGQGRLGPDQAAGGDHGRGDRADHDVGVEQVTEGPAHVLEGAEVGRGHGHEHELGSGPAEGVEDLPDALPQGRGHDGVGAEGAGRPHGRWLKRGAGG